MTTDLKAPHLLALEARDKRYLEEIARLRNALEEVVATWEWCAVTLSDCGTKLMSDSIDDARAALKEQS